MIWFIGYLLISWLIADFITGIFHWLEDRYDFSDLPLIGNFIEEKILKPNINHHLHPQDFTNGSFWHRNLTSFIPAFTVGSIIFYFSPYISLPFFIAGFGNQIHYLSHMKGKVSSFVELLQEIGIFNSPKQHSLHHTNPYDSNYCVISDFLNPILEYFNFWFILENLVFNITGFVPKTPSNYK